MCYFIFANFVAKKGPTPRLWHSNTFCTFQQNPLRESSRIQVNYKKKQKGFIFCGVLEIWSLVARGWQFKKVLPYIKCYFKMQQTLQRLSCHCPLSSYHCADCWVDFISIKFGGGSQQIACPSLECWDSFGDVVTMEDYRFHIGTLHQDTQRFASLVVDDE